MNTSRTSLNSPRLFNDFFRQFFLECTGNSLRRMSLEREIQNQTLEGDVACAVPSTDTGKTTLVNNFNQSKPEMEN